MSAVLRKYRPRLLAGWAEDAIIALALMFFVWLCIGPGLDLLLFVLKWNG